MKIAPTLVQRARKVGADLPNSIEVEELTPSRLVELRQSITKTARATLDALSQSDASEAREIESQHEELMRAFDVIDTELKFRHAELSDEAQRAKMRPIENGSAPARDDGFRPVNRKAFTVRVDGQDIPALRSDERLADHVRASGGPDFSLAQFVRGNLGLSEKRDSMVSSTALVPSQLAAGIIDDVRAKARIVQAGAVTITLAPGTTTMARLIGDPTVYQHDEGVEDLSYSKPTFTPITLNPKSLVALIPLSAELAADSPNLEVGLNASISAAFAQKLDTLSLATILADTDIGTSVANEDPSNWAGVMAALGSMLSDDMEVPQAAIFNAADWVSLTGEQASTAGTWLGAPPALSQMRQLQTTNLAEGRAILGDFQNAFVIGARQELRLEIVRFAIASSYSHVMVAHARMDGYVIQPKHLYTMNAAAEE